MQPLLIAEGAIPYLHPSLINTPEDALNFSSHMLEHLAGKLNEKNIQPLVYKSYLRCNKPASVLLAAVVWSLREVQAWNCNIAQVKQLFLGSDEVRMNTLYTLFESSSGVMDVLEQYPHLISDRIVFRNTAFLVSVLLDQLAYVKIIVSDQRTLRYICCFDVESIIQARHEITNFQVKGGLWEMPVLMHIEDDAGNHSMAAEVRPGGIGHN